MKNKWIHKLLCLTMAGSMVLTAPQAVFASETVPAKEQQESQAPAESETEKKEIPSLKPQTEPQTEPSEDGGKETEHLQTEKPAETEEPQTDVEIPVEDPEKPGEDGVDVDVKGDVQDGEVIQDEGNILHRPGTEEEQQDHSDAAADYSSNIIAGNDVYLGKMSEEYGLKFGEAFASVMEQIEEDYREFLDEPEAFRAENWQDVLAVYVMKHVQEQGEGIIKLNKKSKGELEKLFFVMNLRSNSALLRKLGMEADTEKQKEEAKEETSEEAKAASEKDADEKEYYALTVQDYMTLYGASEEERELLEKYTSTECRQLCAIVTAAKGFVRAAAGTDVSEKRISIVAAACSLIGKVGYFWGGKSYAIGWDDRWGSPETVSALGSKSSGTVRSYGLDCSGFVAWSYYNGLEGEDAGIGNHTSTQWDASEMEEEGSAKPGDMVFYRPGSVGDDNHVGIVISVNDDGSLLVVHCSSGQNGVVTGEAWSSGFQYVRSPLGIE